MKEAYKMWCGCVQNNVNKCGLAGIDAQDGDIWRAGLRPGLVLPTLSNGTRTAPSYKSPWIRTVPNWRSMDSCKIRNSRLRNMHTFNQSKNRELYTLNALNFEGNTEDKTGNDLSLYTLSDSIFCDSTLSRSLHQSFHVWIDHTKVWQGHGWQRK